MLPQLRYNRSQPENRNSISMCFLQQQQPQPRLTQKPPVCGCENWKYQNNTGEPQLVTPSSYVYHNLRIIVYLN